jgi:type IV secretory pathway VirB3-like protein
MDDETVKFWDVPEVKFVVVWVSAAAVLLLGIGVVLVLVLRLTGARDPQGGAHPALAPTTSSQTAKLVGR